MGGVVALTVRFSNGEEIRTSCWTNILRSDLWDSPFHRKDLSEEHTRARMKQLLDNRKKDAEVEQLWGNWNKTAPLEYGIVAIDYVSWTMYSAQGYSDPTTAMIHMSGSDRVRKIIDFYENKTLIKITTYQDRDEVALTDGEVAEVIEECRKALPALRKKEGPGWSQYVSIPFFRDKFFVAHFESAFQITHQSSVTPASFAVIHNWFDLSYEELAAWKEYFKDAEEPVPRELSRLLAKRPKARRAKK